MVKYMKAILRPLKLYSVAVRVFFPDTDLRLSQFLFERDIEFMVSWQRLSEIRPHLTLQVAALMNALLECSQTLRSVKEAPVHLNPKETEGI